MELETLRKMTKRELRELALEVDMVIHSRMSEDGSKSQVAREFRDAVDSRLGNEDYESVKDFADAIYDAEEWVLGQWEIAEGEG